MSEAEKRNGERVWDASWKLANTLPSEARGYMTVGQVAKEAKMSRPSAQKYLEAMVTAKSMVRVIIEGRQRIYRFV